MKHFNFQYTKYLKFINLNSQLIVEILIDEMDLIKIPRIKNEFEDLIENQKLPSIILDLKNVIYIDSIGISFLIMVDKKMKKNEKKVAILCNYEPLIQVFDAVQIKNFLNLFSDINKASKFISELKTIN